MLAYARKNMVVLGLAQIGVMLEGILLCGWANRYGGWRLMDWRCLDDFPAFFLNYGVFFLIVPVVWTGMAIHYCEKDNSTPLREGGFFLAGLLMALLPGFYFLDAIGLVQLILGNH